MTSACGSSSPASAMHPTVKAVAARPTTVTARLLGPRPGVLNVRRGTLMASDELGMRVFGNPKQGFALAHVSSELYPAATTDGGKTWRIDGPVLYVEAAQGPSGVGQVGAVYPGEYFAFGGGSVVDLTTDAGAHWWQAFLGDDVIAVVPGTKPHHLIAVVQNGGPKVIDVVYVSADGGRRWNRTTHFAY